MSREPGTKVTDRIGHGRHTVAGTEVEITELAWNGTDGRSFEVERVSDGFTLTMDEAFDEMPSRSQVRDLVLAERDKYGYIDWSKPERDDPAPYSVAERDEGQFMVYDGPHMTGPYSSRDEAEAAFDTLEGNAS